MLKKTTIAFIFLLVLFTPLNTNAQSRSESEYRTYLLQIIELLQQQIILLQAERTQVAGTLGVPDLDDFESFLIDDSRDVVAWYVISNPELSRILPDLTHGQYFSRFFEIVPDEYEDFFVDLVVFDDRRLEFDGFVETVTPYRPDTWRIGVNQDIFEFGESSSIVEELFVHEFGHIVSYEEISGRPDGNDNGCHEFFADFGCPPANSYLLDFIDEFWSDADMDAALESNDPDWLWTKQELRENFVTDYAATNPAEDFAESFAFFVLEDQSTGMTPKEEKINYFYDFELMRELRDEIRDTL